MFVLTLTLNPAIDQTINLDLLTPGTVHRAKSVRHNAGGKGVNVASCLADWCLPVSASGFLGAHNAAIFDEMFAQKGIENTFLRLQGYSRTNIKLVDPVDTTDINLPGLTVSAQDLAALEVLLAKQMAPKPGTAVLAGSLPLGCPEDVYAGLTRTFVRAGWKVLLDTDGPALKAALHGPDLPFCVKPNRAELAGLLGRELPGLPDVFEAAFALHRTGIALVVVSLGQEGALFVSSQGALLAQAEAPRIVSTVGAGDAMVAGVAAALLEGADLERIARLGTAFAVSKLALPGPNLPDRVQVEQAALAVNIQPAHRRKAQ